MRTVRRPRALPANQRCRSMKARSAGAPAPERYRTTATASEWSVLDAIELPVGQRRLKPEPVVAVGSEGDDVGLSPDRREAAFPQHFDRRVASPAAQVELDGLRRAGEIVHRQHGLTLVGPD